MNKHIIHNKNAFTLVELMGIIIIILLIMLISVPAVTKMIKNAEEQSYQNYIKDLKTASETYIELNLDKYPELKIIDEKVSLKVILLVNEGFLRNDFTNPKTKKPPTANEIIEVLVNGDKTLTYEYKIIQD